MNRTVKQTFVVLVLLSLVLAACGEPAPTATPVLAPTNTAAPQAPPTATSAPAAQATATSASLAQPTATSVPMLQPTDTAAAVAATATAVPATIEPAKAGEKVLRVNLVAEPDSVDPQKMSFTNEIGFGQMVFEALYTLDKNGAPMPAAADGAPTVSADGLTYTVNVKQGLKYSDGVALNAHNFEYAFRRLFDPRLTDRNYASIAYIIKGAAELSNFSAVTDTAQLNALFDNLGVKATDDYTIQFNLTQKAAYFPYILAIWVGWPSRQDMVEQGGATWTEPATYIGNGPYVLSAWSHGSEAVFTANPNYRLGKPKIDRIEFREIQDAEVAYQAYKKGELDITSVPPAELAATRTDATLSGEFLNAPGACTNWLTMNNTKPPFDNIKVRQAFAQAFDRQDYVNTVEQGNALPAFSLIPPARPGYAADIEQYDFDAAAAKSALDAVIKSDYPNGLPAIKLTYGAIPINQTRAEWVQGQLKNNLGLDIALDPVELTVYASLLKSANTAPQFVFAGWCQDYPDPQDWLTLVFRSDSTFGTSGWKNAQFDQLTTAADGESDPTKRADEYHQAQQILAQEAPVFFLYWDVAPSLFKPYVIGLKENVAPTDSELAIPGFTNLVNTDIASH